MSKDFRCDFAGREICLKTDYVAAQADGAVFAQYVIDLGHEPTGVAELEGITLAGRQGPQQPH